MNNLLKVGATILGVCLCLLAIFSVVAVARLVFS
jgi:hypothetical protein